MLVKSMSTGLVGFLLLIYSLSITFGTFGFLVSVEQILFNPISWAVFFSSYTTLILHLSAP
jgi:hypothetical protein